MVQRECCCTTKQKAGAGAGGDAAWLVGGGASQTGMAYVAVSCSSGGGKWAMPQLIRTEPEDLPA